MAELDLAAAIKALDEHLADEGWMSGDPIDSAELVEVVAPFIATAEQERILGTPDEPTGILDRYEVKAYIAPNGKPLHMVYCGRCHHIQITARDLDGDQSGVTLAELAEWAMDHEEEEHAAAESSSPVEATNEQA